MGSQISACNGVLHMIDHVLLPFDGDDELSPEQIERLEGGERACAGEKYGGEGEGVDARLLHFLSRLYVRLTPALELRWLFLSLLPLHGTHYPTLLKKFTVHHEPKKKRLFVSKVQGVK